MIHYARDVNCGDGGVGVQWTGATSGTVQLSKIVLKQRNGAFCNPAVVIEARSESSIKLNDLGHFSCTVIFHPYTHPDTARPENRYSSSVFVNRIKSLLLPKQIRRLFIFLFL